MINVMEGKLGIVAFNPRCNTGILRNVEYERNRTRYMAQSILTCLIDKPELPSYEEARDIVAWAERGVHK